MEHLDSVKPWLKSTDLKHSNELTLCNYNYVFQILPAKPFREKGLFIRFFHSSNFKKNSSPMRKKFTNFVFEWLPSIHHFLHKNHLFNLRKNDILVAFKLLKDTLVHLSYSFKCLSVKKIGLKMDLIAFWPFVNQSD